MADRKKTNGPNAGVNIKSRNVRIEGDVVGRDKNTTTTTIAESKNMLFLSEEFVQIKRKIDKRRKDQNVEKSELRNLVEQIEQEVKKGESANANKVDRWLRFLAEMADDIFDVTVSTLTNPLAGVAKTIQLIAKKAREEKASK